MFGGDEEGELVDDYAVFALEGRASTSAFEPRCFEPPKVRRGAAVCGASATRIVMFSGESTNDEEEPILMHDMFVIHVEEGGRGAAL